jgi:hypothetical protein
MTEIRPICQQRQTILRGSKVEEEEEEQEEGDL